MIKLAIAGNAGFAVSEAELGHEGPSYSISTLERLQREHGSADLRFILGADAVNQIADWREPGRILAEYRPIVMLRAGWPGPDWSRIDQIYPRASQELRVVEVPALEIASSTLRARVAAGQSIRYLVPDSVLEVIEREGLYRLDASSFPE
jgi:nicotinate-nucleotide adenylyltransferase